MKMSREVVVWLIALTKEKNNCERHRFVPDLNFDTNEKTNYYSDTREAKISAMKTH